MNSPKTSSITNKGTKTLTTSTTSRSRRLQPSKSIRTTKQHHLYHRPQGTLMDTKASFSTRIWLRDRLKRMKEPTTRTCQMESTTCMAKDTIHMEIHTISSIKTTMEWSEHQLHTISVGMEIEATSPTTHQ